MSETRFDPDCPFCKRIKNREFASCDDAYIPTAVQFEPLNPVTRGHMLFVPCMHVEHREQDGREANNWLGILFKAAHRYAGRIGGDYNLITSSGSAATQTVPHMHIHYVPRRADDGLHLPWTGQVSS